MVPDLTLVPVEAGHCQHGALTSSYAILIQALLAWLAFLSLVVKRFLEPADVRRPWIIWFMDTSKQGVGMALIHFINVFLAGFFKGDPCTCYVVSFMLDSTIGLLLIYVLVQSVASIARCFQFSTLHFGEYGRPPSCKIWFHQCIAFLIIIVIVKCVVTVIIQSFSFWGDVRRLILSPISSARVELTVVMLVIPFVLNSFMFWMTDNFVKKKTKVQQIEQGIDLDMYDDCKSACSREKRTMNDKNYDVLQNLLTSEHEPESNIDLSQNL